MLVKPFHSHQFSSTSLREIEKKVDDFVDANPYRVNVKSIHLNFHDKKKPSLLMKRR